MSGAVTRSTKLVRAAWLAGLCGSAATVFGFVQQPARAYHAYLVAYAFTLSAALGCLAFVMISHAANTTWPVAVRRLAENVAVALPWLLLLFVPIALGARWLYPWAAPEHYSGSVRALLVHRRPFMNLPFFCLRAALYLGLWSAWALLLRRGSLAMDRGTAAEGCSARLRRLSYAGLPLVGLSAGFAGYDWFMSVAPAFTSSMFAALWLGLCLLTGVATVLLLSAAVVRRPENAQLLNDSHSSALGRLLFAFLFFVGYTAFFQFLLIWIANKPSEAAWYLERMRGAAAWSGWFLVWGAFALPFLLLLSRRITRRLPLLARVAAWCAFGVYVHLHWLIVPSSSGPYFVWIDLAALLAVPFVTFSLCAWQQRGQALTAFADPRYAAALRYESP